jgi:hypothetical protein
VIKLFTFTLIHANNKSGLPAYYKERHRLGYIDKNMELIDLDNDEDWDKVVYHNYMTYFFKKGLIQKY